MGTPPWERGPGSAPGRLQARWTVGAPRCFEWVRWAGPTAGPGEGGCLATLRGWPERHLRTLRSDAREVRRKSVVITAQNFLTSAGGEPARDHRSLAGTSASPVGHRAW